MIHRTLFPVPSSTPELAENVWEQHNTGLVQHTDTCHCPERNEQSIACGNVQPDREESNCEEVVKEYHRLSDNARQESYRSIDALSASLEIPEAPLLESSELGVWSLSVFSVCVAATQSQLTIRCEERV